MFSWVKEIDHWAKIDSPIIQLRKPNKNHCVKSFLYYTIAQTWQTIMNNYLNVTNIAIH